MRWSFGSRAMFAVCCGLVLLLGALAVVQYRWSTRVAAADVQREKEHLTSSAALFATQFNGLVSEAMTFVHEDAVRARDSGKPLTGVPRIIAELWYRDSSGPGPEKIYRLGSDGVFAAASLPDWMKGPGCSPLVQQQPLVMTAPTYDVDVTELHDSSGLKIFRKLSRQAGRCFVARFDESYIRETLIPELIRRSFGETTVQQYDFAVTSSSEPRNILYGKAGPADLRTGFFSATVRPPVGVVPLPDQPGHRAIVIQRSETFVSKSNAAPVAATLSLGPGMWQLAVAHKGMPLEAAMEQKRRRDLMLSGGVELLLLIAILFLVIGARRMQEAAHQKMRFIAGVSHELRTPVSAISMLSRNQADGLVTGSDKVRQYGELMHQQSRRLNDMVEQTLQYAGIHSGLRRPAKDQVDIGRLIRDAVEERKAELAHAGFEVEVDAPESLMVAGDAGLLRTAFDNLLSNAEKYAGGGRWIRVTARHSAEAREIQISVEDRGPGIDVSDQAEIFEPFCRGRAAIEAQIPGSGLGLSLVRSALEAHRGTVTLASEPGRGSTFTLHLPV